VAMFARAAAVPQAPANALASVRATAVMAAPAAAWTALARIVLTISCVKKLTTAFNICLPSSLKAALAFVVPVIMLVSALLAAWLKVFRIVEEKFRTVAL